MHEKYLQDIGLNEKEASVYVALLQVDYAVIQDVAKKTGINRTTIYPVLKSLEKKGLVSETEIDGKIRYVAEAPERLQTYVQRQKILLDEHATRLKDIIPELKSIQREHGERPIIKFFEGKEGAISAYEEFYSLTSAKDQEGYFLYNKNLIESVFTKAEQDAFYTIRHAAKVLPISVYNKDEVISTFGAPGIRTRIDAKKYPISIDMTVIEDKTVIVILGERISSMVIKSKDLAETFASLIRYINDTK